MLRGERVRGGKGRVAPSLSGQGKSFMVHLMGCDRMMERKLFLGGAGCVQAYPFVSCHLGPAGVCCGALV